MTTEIVQFKCPSCGHLLGEEEYRHACEKNQIQIDEIVKEKSLQKIEQLKIEQSKEIHRLNKRFELERENEVNTRVAKALNEEKVWMQLKHEQDLAEKDKQIDAAKSQQDERIRRAIIDNELKHAQKENEFELQHSRIEANNKKLLERVEKLQKTLDNIPPEVQGTSGEFSLIDELRNEFRREISPKKVGVAMADVVQVIVTDTGEIIKTPIVYDKKTGEKVSVSDIVKAKNYRTVHKTDHSIIVTKDIKNNRFTEVRDGVLLVHPVAVVDIAKRIRWFLIEKT